MLFSKVSLRGRVYRAVVRITRSNIVLTAWSVRILLNRNSGLNDSLVVTRATLRNAWRNLLRRSLVRGPRFWFGWSGAFLRWSRSGLKGQVAALSVEGPVLPLDWQGKTWVTKLNVAQTKYRVRDQPQERIGEWRQRRISGSPSEIL